MNDPLIELRDLAYAYPDGTCALNGISFAIARGEAVAVTGGNGAGKSTLLMLLAGCHAAAGGMLRIGGETIGKAGLDVLRRRVGMVFQDSDEQLFMPTVWDDVAFGPLNKGLPGPEVERVVGKTLAAVGMDALRKKAPYRLSGGQKRLVALAAILAMRPEVLALDEPTASLDPKARRAFINTLNGLEHTKIIATHDLEMVIETCPRTIVMAQGVVVADGPTRTVLADERALEKGHLEKPMSLLAER